MIVYSVPALTGVDIGVAQFGELFAHDSIVGVKFTAADFYLLERLRSAYPNHLIYAGFDEMLLPALVNGVDGAIGSTYNVNGLRARQVINLAKVGEFDKAFAVQRETNDLISAILANGLYPTIKQLLVLSGCDAGPFLSRRPMASASAEQIARAKEIYAQFLA